MGLPAKKEIHLKAEMPKKLEGLFKLNTYRNKVSRGGRGSGKSWSFSRALLILGVLLKLRILCAREIQNSIKDSVHKLLSDQIEIMGLKDQYHVLDTQIRGANGTEFTFTGLSTLTVDTIKSFEGYDICWVEEGQVVSKRSWDILIPTIRKDRATSKRAVIDSEIWVTYNPDLETDETHQRFTIHPPPRTLNVEMNWRDNKFFGPILNEERLYCKQYRPDDYDNIWEGKCRPAVEGAIYYKQIEEAERQGRICNVPYDPLLRVHVILDLGWDDSLSAGLVQKNASECRVIEYIETRHTKLDILSSYLKQRPYNWGNVWLPHDGYSGSLNTGGKSTYDILTSLGWDVVTREEITELTVEEGIRNVRLTFPRLSFDAKKTAAMESPKIDMKDFTATPLNWRLIEALKRYKRHINRMTRAVGKPVHDEHCHGADVLRYICANLDNMKNTSPVTYFHQGMVVNASV